MFLMDIESKRSVLKSKEKEARDMEKALRADREKLSDRKIKEKNDCRRYKRSDQFNLKKRSHLKCRVSYFL